MSVVVVCGKNINDKEINYHDIFNSILLKTKNVLEINKNIELNIKVIDDKEMISLNKETRNINKTTDVLSFPMNIHYGDTEFLGDMFISLDVAKKQAEEQNQTLKTELSFLFTHGLLHLLGYDHDNKKNEVKMFEIKDKILLGDDE